MHILFFLNIFLSSVMINLPGRMTNYDKLQTII